MERNINGTVKQVIDRYDTNNGHVRRFGQIILVTMWYDF